MLVKAKLTQLESLESLEVLWNPQSYRIERRTAFSVARVPGSARSVLQGAAGGEERFSTRLFLDSSPAEGAARDLRPWVSRLEGWAAPMAGSGLPPGILFHWGSGRFRGVMESLDEEWVAFDPDGTPIRAWLDLVLIR